VALTARNPPTVNGIPVAFHETPSPETGAGWLLAHHDTIEMGGRLFRFRFGEPATSLSLCLSLLSLPSQGWSSEETLSG
jgi:hypothetical protein